MKTEVVCKVCRKKVMRKLCPSDYKAGKTGEFCNLKCANRSRLKLPLDLDPDLLRKWYVEEKQSLSQIARKFGCGQATVKERLQSLGVRTRIHAEQVKLSPSNWKGGRHTYGQGYVWVWTGDKSKNHGYEKEHRLVMEKMLGRKLRKGESVHHINYIRDDNREENLVLMKGDKSHKELDCRFFKACRDYVFKQNPPWIRSKKALLKHLGWEGKD